MANEPLTTYQSWDLWLKLLSPVAAIASVLVAYAAFATQAEQFTNKMDFDQKALLTKLEQDKQAEIKRQEAEMAQRAKDYKVKFYDRQLDIYLELCQLTGKISRARLAGEVWQDIRRFNELLVGKLLVISDTPVYGAALQFNERLRMLTPNNPMPRQAAELAYDISIKCRDSLKAAFDVPGIGDMSQYAATVKMSFFPDDKK